MSDGLFRDPLPITIEAQIECVVREINMRERVYPRRVAEGKMSQALAAEQLELMRAVLTTLQALR